MLRFSTALLHAAALCACIAIAAPAGAADDAQIEAASRLFEQGAEEQKRGDFRSAAASFARADELVPDPAALGAALRAAMLADDPLLVMTLVERAQRAPPPASLARAIDAARTKFGPRVGRLRIRCSGCRVTVNGASMAVNASLWLLPGDHEVVIEAGGRSDRRSLHVEAGSSTDVVPLEVLPPEKAKLPVPKRERDAPVSGLPQAWFWVALGVTAVAGGATIASGLDTRAQKEAFDEAPSVEAQQSGESAQLRTNILGGVTAALGLATVGIGLFAVRWSEPRSQPATATLDLTAGRALLTVRGRF